jgi:hypothetical protein
MAGLGHERSTPSTEANAAMGRQPTKALAFDSSSALICDDPAAT